VLLLAILVVTLVNGIKKMSDYWKDNNITKPQQIVVCAANRYRDIIVCGARHYDKVMHGQIAGMGGLNALLVDDIKVEQGFINQFCEFLTRNEALKVVKENNQPFNQKRNGSSTELFSEGLY